MLVYVIITAVLAFLGMVGEVLNIFDTIHVIIYMILYKINSTIKIQGWGWGWGWVGVRVGVGAVAEFEVG